MSNLKQSFLPQLEQFERSICDCNKCKIACKSIPGSLAPGDAARIINFAKPDDQPVEDFVQEHFRASSGTKAIDDQGKPMMIPTIVPAQKEDGRCVFLTGDDHCGIHPVSPYGCRNFTVCGQDGLSVDEESMRSSSQVSNILFEEGHNYFKLWSFLKSAGLVAMDILSRKSRFIHMLDQEGKKEE